MTRALYVSLLRLHPPAFRRQFAGEMLWIFDEARVSEGAIALLFDLLISVTRQWLLRSGVWKLALALAGAAFQVMAGGAGYYAFHRHVTASQVGGEMTPLMNDLILLTLASVSIVIVTVLGSTLWVGRFNRRRVSDRRRH
jgi:hypothetical protein